MKHERLVSALVAVGLTAAATVGLTQLSTTLLDDYGLALFVGVPVVGGALAALIFGRRESRSLRASLGVAAMAGGVGLLGFLALGLEGVICLVMAFPVVAPLFLIGGALGYALTRVLRDRRARDVACVLLVALVPMVSGFFPSHGGKPREREVVSRVIIRADVQDVWREVVAFSPIPDPPTWLFRAGIAYPTHAEIVGTGVGAVRYCHFSTGAFVEPITRWEEGRRLSFDVESQPRPMIEVSPYGSIHPPHLDWALRSKRGEFRLRSLPDGAVELAGPTWFEVRMGPELYWGWLSDAIIHQIHVRVLEHIRREAERAAVSSGYERSTSLDVRG